MKLARTSLSAALAALVLSPLAFAHDGPGTDHRNAPPDALSVTAAVVTGSGVNTYQSVANWCQTPTGKVELGSATHGGVVVDKAGLIYISMDGGPHGLLVYGADGKMVRGIADKYTGIHGLNINEENGEEFIYGARNGHAEVLKMKLDGTIVWTIPIPMESGKYDDPKAPVEYLPPAKPSDKPKAKPRRTYNPTGIAVAPNLHVFVVDGYGQNWVHEFDENQKYVKSFGGPGPGDGKFSTCHGIAIDNRTGKPLLLICDRAAGRLQHFDLEGKFVDVIPLTKSHRPCAVSIRGKNVAIAELDGRVEILDETNKVVSVLGENSDKTQVSTNRVPPELWQEGIFTAPHGLSYDHDGNLYVEDWNVSGRISKMEKFSGQVVAHKEVEHKLAPGEYRLLKKEDGIQFAIRGAAVLTIPGQPREHTIGGFGLVDSRGTFIPLELLGNKYTDESNYIDTKIFGRIKVLNSQRDLYAATEVQIKQIREFLSAQAK